MRKARVIITFKCSQNCPYCVNRYPEVLKQVIKLSSIHDLQGYDEIMITGGEPSEYEDLINLLKDVRHNNPAAKIYLYSSRYNSLLKDALPYVDGINYTIHDNGLFGSIAKFKEFQIQASRFPEKSFSLNLGPTIIIPIPINPVVWSRLKIKRWKGPDERCIPEGEELFVLEKALDDEILVTLRRIEKLEQEVSHGNEKGTHQERTTTSGRR